MELSKTRFNLYSSLGSVKMRRRHGLFTVEGEKSVAECMKKFDCEAIITLRGATVSPYAGAYACYEVDEALMRRLSNLSTASNIMGVFRMPAVEVDSLKVEADLYVVLDGVQDPGNLGTIIRTCHWFGIKRIFASRDTVDLFNPKTVQSTMGSIGHVDVTYCGLPDLFSANPDLPVYGTLLDGENIFTRRLSHSGFIVMGNEGNGLSPAVRGCVTDPLMIPPHSADHSESLNVAIATAIVVACFRH